MIERIVARVARKNCTEKKIIVRIAREMFSVATPTFNHVTNTLPLFMTKQFFYFYPKLHS